MLCNERLSLSPGGLYAAHPRKFQRSIWFYFTLFSQRLIVQNYNKFRNSKVLRPAFGWWHYLRYDFGLKRSFYGPKLHKMTYLGWKHTKYKQTYYIKRLIIETFRIISEYVGKLSLIILVKTTELIFYVMHLIEFIFEDPMERNPTSIKTIQNGERPKWVILSTGHMLHNVTLTTNRDHKKMPRPSYCGYARQNALQWSNIYCDYLRPLNHALQQSRCDSDDLA